VPETIPSWLGLALAYLRAGCGWTRARLAQALGHSSDSLLARYELGTQPLSPENLDSLLAPLPLEARKEAVEVLHFTHRLIFPDRSEETASPFPLTAEEQRRIDRATLSAAWAAAETVRAELMRWKKREKQKKAEQQAEELLQTLLRATPRERRGLVEVFPDFWTSALAVRVCEASERSAAHSAQQAIELAMMAVSIAERVPGAESWHRRLEGFCWAYVGNARRVANDFDGADEAFTRAWELWQAGSDSKTDMLPEWLLLDLEASLRRAERRFSESLALLDRARTASEGDPIAAARILLKKEHVFNQMEDIHSALQALAEAAPLVEVSGKPRQIFALRFNMADDLCHLERYDEAAGLLQQIRELAVEQANELDLVRVGWLQAKVDAGQSRVEAATAGLEQVRGVFTARELPYDAALASLDLAVLWLKEDRTTEVRDLALAMGWIFKAKGIDREALAALSLFCEAAWQESATAELARSAIKRIEKARRSVSVND
jgi:transcriptional regulator with XRE-family HTH domain